MHLSMKVKQIARFHVFTLTPSITVGGGKAALLACGCEAGTEGEPSQIDTCCVESYFGATSCTAALLFFFFGQHLPCLPSNF